MIYLFWILAVPTAAFASLMFLMSVAGRQLSQATPIWISLLASFSILVVLVFAYRLAANDGRPGAASGVVALSWLLFAIIMLVNGLVRPTGWQ
jgi:hypothetical protein